MRGGPGRPRGVWKRGSRERRGGRSQGRGSVSAKHGNNLFKPRTHPETETPSWPPQGWGSAGSGKGGGQHSDASDGPFASCPPYAHCQHSEGRRPHPAFAGPGLSAGSTPGKWCDLGQSININAFSVRLLLKRGTASLFTSSVSEIPGTSSALSTLCHEHCLLPLSAAF